MSLKAVAQLNRGLLLPQCSLRAAAPECLVAESECKWQPNIPPAAAPVAAPAELARWLCGRAQLNPYKRTAT